MNDNYVDVKDEPLHIEAFTNRYIRLYHATLLPGIETKFHRHCEDTIYIVLSGGAVATKLMKGTSASPTFLPISFSLKMKIGWAVKRFLNKGFLELPSGFFFSMPSRTFPVIHKAKASAENLYPIVLVGIEIRETQNNCINVPDTNSAYKKEFENERYSVSGLFLKPGESSGGLRSFSGITIIIEGEAVVPEKNRKLKSGEYLWHEMDESLNFCNYSNENIKALTIVLK